MHAFLYHVTHRDVDAPGAKMQRVQRQKRIYKQLAYQKWMYCALRYMILHDFPPRHNFIFRCLVKTIHASHLLSHCYSSVPLFRDKWSIFFVHWIDMTIKRGYPCDDLLLRGSLFASQRKWEQKFDTVLCVMAEFGTRIFVGIQVYRRKFFSTSQSQCK